MTAPVLRRVAAGDVSALTRPGRDPDTERAAAGIVADVRRGGEAALREHIQRLDGRPPGSPLTYDRAAMDDALRQLDAGTRATLERLAGRIRAYAGAQRAALHAMAVPVPGGIAGHTIVPIFRAGCYAPAGRAPLPSSLMMAAVTARVAGVPEVIVATPNPSAVMLASAAIAGADLVLAAGGAHAVAALAYGVGVPPCDIVVGPGNRWVTAAKRCVVGDVAIDMLAGPSELVVVADASADPAVVAADLLAQAEHDPDAFVALVSMAPALIEHVEQELGRQLTTLSTAAVARAALAHGVAVACVTEHEAVRVCNALAPEHLQLSLVGAEAFAVNCRSAGAVFLGEQSAEVFGDYGVGGNHVLPTQGGSRFTGGLSVLTFVRVRSWLRVDDASRIAHDVAAMARIEGLEAHARAAERRAPVVANGEERRQADSTTGAGGLEPQPDPNREPGGVA